MEQVPQPSKGEALYGRPEAPERAGVPSHIPTRGGGASTVGLFAATGPAIFSEELEYAASHAAN
jgi:hypothetical protein